MPLTGEEIRNIEIEYHDHFGHTLGSIYHIDMMRIVYIFYISCRLGAYIVSPPLPRFQGFKSCAQFLDINLNGPNFYP